MTLIFLLTECRSERSGDLKRPAVARDAGGLCNPNAPRSGRQRDLLETDRREFDTRHVTIRILRVRSRRRPVVVLLLAISARHSCFGRDVANPLTARMHTCGSTMLSSHSLKKTSQNPATAQATAKNECAQREWNRISINKIPLKGTSFLNFQESSQR